MVFLHNHSIFIQCNIEIASNALFVRAYLRNWFGPFPTLQKDLVVPSSIFVMHIQTIVKNKQKLDQFSVRLDWAFCPIRASAFFQWVPWVLFTNPQKLAKQKILDKFGSHSTIHIFKNYFAIVFSVISFQFSPNKRYPNTPLAIFVNMPFRIQ